MAHAHDGGGGGGGGYGDHTQRALLALIGSTALTNIRATRNMWEDTALKASTIADLVEARLDALTSEDGGWTGPGAESFKALVRKDLVHNLRAYALRAAGVSKSGNANTGYAADLKPVEQQVDASYSTATHHNIPWDVDTQWRVDQEVPDQGLLSKVEEVVQGEDEDYEEEKKKAPYMILNGQASTLKKVPQPEWESLEQSITPVSPPDVFTRAQVPVDAQVHRFDRLMEAQQMNDGVKSSVRTAANDVHGKLAAYQPQDLEEFTFTGGKLANGDQVSDHNGAGAPGPGGQSPTPKPPPGNPGTPGPTPGPGGPGPETPGPQDPTNPHPPGPGVGGPTPGPDGPGPGGPGGPGVPPDVPTPPDPMDPTLPGPGDGGDGPGGYQDPGTGGAGVTPGTPGAPGVGGIGGPGVGGPAPSPTIGTGPGAPGAGGMGALGVGGPVASGGGPGVSFQMGANGKPMVNPGSVGPVAGANGASPGGGAGAGSGTGAGSGGAGGAGAPMGQRRGQGGDEEETGEEIDGTWLEEDESVWGNRAGAPPAEIR